MGEMIEFQRLHRYDAQHAFMNDARPDVYDEVAARTAWQRTQAFPQRTLV